MDAENCCITVGSYQLPGAFILPDPEVSLSQKYPFPFSPITFFILDHPSPFLLSASPSLPPNISPVSKLLSPPYPPLFLLAPSLTQIFQLFFPTTYHFSLPPDTFPHLTSSLIFPRFYLLPHP
ncbi:hypothetical protein PoB_002289300 [Plakobranchus ocellatus]|uniref:Uncharacterized protein n=1 Tax=Plakobranchus ocellatus TaxID=259542 RepID=A0AAV3ZP85_9GAST|nr:hypothetical protein PoB_002289300 [Plakobranchus ocellatus]